MMRICAQTDPYLTGRVGAWAYVGLEIAGANVDDVATKLVAMPEVLILTISTGRHTLQAFVVGRHRSELVDTILGEIRGLRGVKSTETAEIIRTVKLDYQWARLF